jgi:hypothetical protein
MDSRLSGVLAGFTVFRLNLLEVGDAVNPKGKSPHLAWGFLGYLSLSASERQMPLDTCRRTGIIGLPLRYLGFSEKQLNIQSLQGSPGYDCWSHVPGP